MKGKNFITTEILMLIAMMIGCSSDRVLLMTKTNVGIDVDNKPPTAEITIARRELAIQPTFPVNYGQNAGKESIDQELGLPLLAAFGLQGNIISPRITGHFAGGDAAYFLAKENVDDDNGNNSDEEARNELCLMTEPADSRNWLKKLITPTEEYQKEVRQFYFATDTSYGLKVAWSGTSGPYPDSLKLGYNRKEFASPPVFVNKGCRTDVNGWAVKLPSFYASTDNGSGWEESEKFIGFDAKTKHIQFFATGSAATEFAKRRSVRQMAFQNMAPDAAKIESKNSSDQSTGAFQNSDNKIEGNQ